MTKPNSDTTVYTSLDKVIEEMFPHALEIKEPEIESLCSWDAVSGIAEAVHPG